MRAFGPLQESQVKYGGFRRSVQQEVLDDL
jgi:hypothetical protein